MMLTAGLFMGSATARNKKGDRIPTVKATRRNSCEDAMMSGEGSHAFSNTEAVRRHASYCLGSHGSDLPGWEPLFCLLGLDLLHTASQ